MTDQLLEQIRAVIREEIVRALEEHGRPPRQRTKRPPQAGTVNASPVTDVEMAEARAIARRLGLVTHDRPTRRR